MCLPLESVGHHLSVHPNRLPLPHFPLPLHHLELNAGHTAPHLGFGLAQALLGLVQIHQIGDQPHRPDLLHPFPTNPLLSPLVWLLHKVLLLDYGVGGG